MKNVNAQLRATGGQHSIYCCRKIGKHKTKKSICFFFFGSLFVLSVDRVPAPCQTFRG